MPTQFKHLDFSGQNIYVGIDTHKKQHTISVLSEEMYLKTFTQPPVAQTLSNYLRKNYPGANYFAAYEASYCGFWLQEQLQSLGVNCIVVNAADVPTSDKERRQKRDPMDSKKIGRELRSGNLSPIYVPSKKTQCDRSLIRARKKLVGDLARSKNRIKSHLAFFGIDFPPQFEKTGTHWSKRFISWLNTLQMEYPTGELALKAQIHEAEQLRELLLKLERDIRKLSRTSHYKKNVDLLMSVPGIGRITAMTLLTELENITRFKGTDQLCAYIGLVPNVSASGEVERTGKMTKRSNRMLRNLLIESSWTAIRNDPALTLKYNELCKRMKPNKAIIRIARKLVSRIRAVLINEIAYQNAIVA